MEAVGIDEPLARYAGEVADACRLRAYDAVHLASALALADEDLVVVSGDADLIRGARAVGLNTAPV